MLNLADIIPPLPSDCIVVNNRCLVYEQDGMRVVMLGGHKETDNIWI